MDIMPPTQDDSLRAKIAQGLRTGSKRGLSGFVWLVKLLVPLSLLTTLLHWSGLLGKADFLLQPLMAPLGLPPEAALPLVVAGLGGFYGGLAIITALPFTLAQLNLMGIFMLLAHALPQEGVIQAKSGLNPVKATIFRLVAASLTVALAGRLMGGDTAASISQTLVQAARPDIWLHLQGWLWETTELCIKILVIIVILNIAQEILKTMGWQEKITRPLKPFLKAMGLSRRAGFLWLTAMVFGLVYGAALIVEEANEGYLEPDELEDLQLSIGLNHAMIEDTIIMVAIGCNLLWIVLPRLVVAMAAVRLLGWFRKWRRKRKGLFAQRY